jgi:hypothetical protein
MNTKEFLLLRRAELQDKLKPFYSLKSELEDVEKALRALEPSCNGCDSGCDICRTGMRYR